MMILDGCKAQIVGLPDHLAWLDTSSCKPHSERRRRYQARPRSEEHTSELQSQSNLVCRLLLEKKKPLAHRRRAGDGGADGASSLPGADVLGRDEAPAGDRGRHPALPPGAVAGRAHVGPRRADA